MLGLRKPKLRTKNIPFEKSRNAENCKRGTLSDFLNIHSVANFQKKVKGEPLESLKSFETKTKKMRNFKSHSAKKSKKRTLRDFLTIRSVAKHEKIEGRTLWGH